MIEMQKGRIFRFVERNFLPLILICLLVSFINIIKADENWAELSSIKLKFTTTWKHHRTEFISISTCFWRKIIFSLLRASRQITFISNIIETESSRTRLIHFVFLNWSEQMRMIFWSMLKLTNLRLPHLSTWFVDLYSGLHEQCDW